MAFPQPTVSAGCPETVEDALAELSASTVVVRGSGHVIYEPGDPATSLFFVLDGRIKISRAVGASTQIGINILGPGDSFGEAALLGGCHSELATVMQHARMLACPASALEDLIVTNPQFSLALLQKVIRQSREFTDRIASLGTDNISRRLARLLLHYGERFGVRTEDGSVELTPLTHELLSEYIGTSRELVTHVMNRFRRAGLIRYSRREIVLAEPKLRLWLNGSSAV
jgi:CRP-like cAMP-binding protein